MEPDKFEIDFNTYLIALSMQKHGSEEEKLDMVFKFYDLNKKNKIDAKNLVDVFKASHDALCMDKFDKKKLAKEKVKRVMEKLGRYLKCLFLQN